MTHIFFEEIRKNCQSEKIVQVKRTNAPYLLLFFVSTYGQMEDLMHIYLYGVSMNRMLISQLKRFLGVKFMFPHKFNV